MSGLLANTISASSGTTITVPSGTVIYNPGRVIQIKNTWLSDPTTFSLTGAYNLYQDIPNLYVTITPYKPSSRFYIACRVFCEGGNVNTPTWDGVWVIKRNGYAIGLPPQPGTLPVGQAMGVLGYYSNDQSSTPEMVFWDYVDTPNLAGPITYQVALSSQQGTTMYINRTVTDTNAGNFERGTSSITVWEIAG